MISGIEVKMEWRANEGTSEHAILHEILHDLFVHFLSLVEPERDVLTSGDHVDVFGIELTTVNCASVSFRCQNCPCAGLRLPAMNFTVSGTCEEREKWKIGNYCSC